MGGNCQGVGKVKVGNLLGQKYLGWMCLGGNCPGVLYNQLNYRQMAAFRYVLAYVFFAL